MSIEYPLILPTTPGFKSLEFRARQISALTASPFTGQQQTYEWPGEWWEADCSLPPMARAAAEEWLATFIALRGSTGTFLLGDRGGKIPQGSGAGYPSVDGAAQLGKTLATLGWNPSSSGVLKKGDYLQIVKNYEPYPRAFDNAHWTKYQCTITATNIVAPNGVAEAERATPDGGATGAYLWAIETTYPSRFKGLTWVFSIWLKAASGTPSIQIQIYNAGAGGQPITCNLTTSWQRFSPSYAFPADATALYVQIGGGSTWPEADGPIDMWGAAVYCPTLDARLHKSVTQLNSSAAGKGYGDPYQTPGIDIWPRLRESPADFSALILTDAKGTFRLAAPFAWSLDEILHYGINFKAVEAF